MATPEGSASRAARNRRMEGEPVHRARRHVHAGRDQRGGINHIWMTPVGNYRLMIPVLLGRRNGASVEVPVGDFFAAGWGMGNEPDHLARGKRIPGAASYWQMPFGRGAASP